MALVHPDGYRITQILVDRGRGPVPQLRLTRLGAGVLGTFATPAALLKRLEQLGLDVDDFTDDES